MNIQDNITRLRIILDQMERAGLIGTEEYEVISDEYQDLVLSELEADILIEYDSWED